MTVIRGKEFAPGFESSETVCPACGAGGMQVFYRVADVPVHSVLLFPTQEKALSYPKGDIHLGFCRVCGFISNTVFDASVHQYSSQYEETQGFSVTFQDFHRALAERLISRYNLRGKTLIEIGCGKGEFLNMLCELGGNRGIGFDPAYVPERNTSAAAERISFIKDFYSERYAQYRGDFVCCKMTLEHIPDVYRFMQTVRRSVGESRETIIFFMIPEMRRIVRERAFWDIYYEHCSYFTAGSLARLFRRSGFDVLAVGEEYGGQYLTIEAKIAGTGGSSLLPGEESPAVLEKELAEFVSDISRAEGWWHERLRKIESDGLRAVIWGGGSKGVAFLTKLGIRTQIPYAVDINPYRHGTFMGGTGQEIVPPSFLKEYRPHFVIVMNPIYLQEVAAELDQLGVSSELVPITERGLEAKA
jgi:hypothetical protein